MPARASTPSDDIRFYGSQQPYFELANFYPSPIDLDGESWPTVEHYFQAQKTQDAGWRERIRTARTPGAAKRLGRSVPDYADEQWLARREDVMRGAIHAKFTQHPDLRRLLLDTGDKTLIEDTSNDPYWGLVGDNGENRLGHLLMELRRELAQASSWVEDESSPAVDAD